MTLHHPIVTDMAAHLREAPHLDLSEIQEPWMYLRSRGYTHQQLQDHLDPAIQQARLPIAQHEAAPSFAHAGRAA